MRVYCSIGHSKGELEAAVTGRGGGDLSTGGAVGSGWFVFHVCKHFQPSFCH